MGKAKSVAIVAGVTGAFIVAAVLGLAPAFAQNGADGADNFSAGIALGRTLHDSRKCNGSGDYYQGCLDGVQESQFDQQADQALSSGTFDEKPPAIPPPLSSPPSVPQDPSNKPGDNQPPND